MVWPYYIHIRDEVSKGRSRTAYLLYFSSEKSIIIFYYLFGYGLTTYIFATRSQKEKLVLLICYIFLLKSQL
jgi:hypothetical protein